MCCLPIVPSVCLFVSLLVPFSVRQSWPVQGPYAPQGSGKLRKWSRRSKSVLQTMIRTSKVRYSRSIGEVNSNRVTSSLLRKRTRLPTHAHEVRALTFEVTDNFGSNVVLPCGAYGPRWSCDVLVPLQFHPSPDGQQRKVRSLLRAATEPVWTEMWLSSSCRVSRAMSHGGAHPSPSQTTADVLHLAGSPWPWTRSRWVPERTSSALAGNLHCGGHSPSDAVPTSPPHVV